MADLNFNTGLKTYTVNGRGEITFNPADDELARRIYKALDTLQNKSEEYSKAIEQAQNTTKVFDVTSDINKEIRSLIDSVFDQPVSDIVFGNMSANAFSDGEPLWLKFLLMIIDELEGAYAREQKKTKSKIDKYTKKYDQKYHR